MIAMDWSVHQRHLLSFRDDHFGDATGMKTTASPEIVSLLPIDRDLGVPLQQQIYDGLRNAILAGLLRAGQRVPSTRALAKDIGVSRLPVLSAYDQLLHEGYLEGRIGSGTFVSVSLPDDAFRSVSPSRPSQSPDHSPLRPRPGRHSPIQAPRQRDDGGMRPLRVSLPALDQFPHTTWSRLVARHARALTPARMAYGDPAGVGSFRAAVAEHLRTARAVRCEAEQVLIVSGSQAALCLCAAVLLGRGDVVAMEEPGYPGAHSALVTRGAVIAPVPIDHEGIQIEPLHALGSKVRAAYVTPSHQYPMGTAMTATRRLELVEWATRHSAWILEDDYDSEFRYVSRPLGALQGMDAHERVIYIGTFSKVLFPSIRVGYIVVPPSLWDAFVEAREALDIFSPTLYQLALRDFIREGHFARHLRRMRALYLQRRAALLEGLAEYCADRLAIYNADAGLHISTLLPEGVDDLAIIGRMRENGLAGEALSECYAGDAAIRSGLLLGFGGSDETSIANATRVLGRILRHGM
jgi:GntR family transcriptional regulator / MocR family aminotransferase